MKKKVALCLGVVVVILGAAISFVSKTEAEKIKAEKLTVCSFDRDSNCKVIDNTDVYVSVAGRYDISGVVELGTHNESCAMHEDFSLYINGKYVTTAYDVDSCDRKNKVSYDEKFGSAYLDQGKNKVEIRHARPIENCDKDCMSLRDSEEVSVTLTFTKPDTVNGTCGSSNGQVSTSKPTSGLCSLGTASSVSGSGPWSWTCHGLYGGSNATCSAATPSCGNGKVESGETCDDGNTTNGDGCSSTCSAESATSVCGNGKVETGETCDDSNTTNGDGCSSTCSTEEKKEEKKDDKKDSDKCDGSIGNYIWNDANMNGVQDSNEKGIGNIQIKAVWDGGDGKFGDSDDKEYKETTNGNGHYKFEGLCKGEYKITVKDEDVKNFEQTYDPDGKKDNKTHLKLDSNNDESTKADFGYAGKTVPVTGPGEVAAALSLLTSGASAVAYRKFRK